LWCRERFSRNYKNDTPPTDTPKLLLIAVVSGSGDAGDGNLRSVSDPNVGL